MLYLVNGNQRKVRGKFRERIQHLTEVDIGFTSMSASDPGDCRNRAALLEGDELVEVVEVGEHLKETASNQKIEGTQEHMPRT